VTDAAPYDPATLRRIKAGVPAFALGWSQDRYERVCRRHGFEIMGGECAAPSIVPDEPKPWQPPPVQADRPVRNLSLRKKKPLTLAAYVPGIDTPRWDAQLRSFMADGKIVEIHGRSQIRMMDVLFGRFQISPKQLIDGRSLASESDLPYFSLTPYVQSVDGRLSEVGWHIEGHKGRGGGYRLARIKP
jgi:hypothetical protein